MMTPDTDDMATIFSSPVPAPEPEPAPVEPTADDVMASCVEVEAERRRWLRAITPLIEAYGSEPERDPVVQAALDSLVVAAVARLKRILRSDLGG